MADHPYRTLPPHQFWSRAIAEVRCELVDPVVEAKFKLGPTDRVATAGSCFAQHIARHLGRSGFNYFVTEPANPIVPPNLAEAYGYGLFTARYGNIYTSRQALQLLHRAYGLTKPADDFWLRPDGRALDPYRPRIQPDGFASVAELKADRKQHFQAVRRAVEELDVLVFTLGLTEGWLCRKDGMAYPLCPGVAGGRFDPDKHVFHNLGVAEVVADLEQAIAFVRERNQGARFILTVSPVPLIASAEPGSVLVSTTYSKSVLRVAAGDIARRDDRVAYFPSYEIITGNFTRGRYFAEDLRSVTEAGVDHVMRLFMAHYAKGQEAAASPPDPQRAEQERRTQAVAQAVAVVCDEEALDRPRDEAAA